MGNGFGGWGGFGGGNMMLGYDFPWLLNGQQGINANTNAGFDHAATQSAIASLQNGVTSGFGDVQLGIAGVNQNICQTGNSVINALNSGFANAETSNNARQIANMQTAFAGQTAMNQGFNDIGLQLCQASGENRLAVAGLNSTIANEECATRANSTQNTQTLLNTINSGIQSIKDQLCQDKIDAKNDEISQLRQEVLYARGQASQLAQNQTIVDNIYDRLNTCPVGTTPVYGRTPIFTCNNGCSGSIGGFNGTF